QSVTATGHTLDDRRLATPEAVITENVFEDALGVVEHEGLQIEPRIIAAGSLPAGRRPARWRRSARNLAYSAQRSPPRPPLRPGRSGVFPRAAPCLWPLPPP